MASRFAFSKDEITPRLQGSDARAKAYISKITTYNALAAEAYARQNAPWTDRTGNARAGLSGIADNSQAGAGHWEINVVTAVSYGIWLEVRFGGRYAIIAPTIEDIFPQYLQMADDLYDNMFGAPAS